MNYFIERTENVLQHEGNENSGRYPLGSGKRPFQHRGGSSSKRRKAADMSDDELIAYNKRKGLENQYNKLSKGEADKLEKTRNLINETSNAFNRTSNMLRQDANQKTWSRMDLSKMSDQELRDKINRENLEIQYSKMFNSSSPEISKGREWTQKIFDVGGDVLSFTGSALTIALAIKALKGV